MSVMMMSSSEHSYQVDSKTCHTDYHKLVGVHLWRVDKPLNCFNNNENGDEDEEDAICEATEGLDARITATKSSSWGLDRLRESHP